MEEGVRFGGEAKLGGRMAVARERWSHAERDGGGRWARSRVEACDQLSMRSEHAVNLELLAACEAASGAWVRGADRFARHALHCISSWLGWRSVRLGCPLIQAILPRIRAT